MKTDWRHLWPALAIFAIVVAVFGRALGFGFVLWDDPQYIRDNPLVQPQIPWPADGIFTPALGYPIPVTMAIYRATALFFGVQPAAFHALNLLLHATNAALFFFLLRRTTTLPAAWLGTALWALHPLVVEPVVWCTGTKDLLYATGFLLTLHAGHARDRVPPWLLLVGLAAFLAKPTAVVLPLVLIWTVMVLQGREGLRRPGLALATAVLTVLAGAIFAAGLFLAAHAGADGYTTLDATPTTLQGRFSGVLQALDLQFRHVVWPRGLLPQYFRLTDLQLSDPPLWRGLLALIALIALLVRVWRAEDRHLRWWLGLAAITYAPVSQLVPIIRFTCDSYAYVPLACLSGLAATALAPYLNKRSTQGLAVAFCGGLAALTVAQQTLWQDSLTLWGTNLAAEPHRALLIKRYAESLDGDGRRGEAYTFLRPRLEDVKRERVVDGMVLTVFADRAPLEEARALYAWAYANEPNLRPDAHRNFCTFLVQRQVQMTSEERQNLTRALDELRRYHARREEIGALVALGTMAGDQRLWIPAGELLEQAYRLSHDPRHGQAAYTAYRAAGPSDSRASAGRDRLQRVQPALATPAPVR